MNNSRNTNKMVVPGAKQAIEKMKYEIANELGVLWVLMPLQELMVQ